jgi:hypothetical protein
METMIAFFVLYGVSAGYRPAHVNAITVNRIHDHFHCVLMTLPS